MRMRKVLAGGAAATLLAATGYGAATWYRYGRAPRRATGGEPLDRFMPKYDVREHHQATVRAPAAVTYAAARELDLHRSPLVGGIFQARRLLLGGRIEPPRAGGPFLHEAQALGWRVLAEEPGRE